MYSKLLKSFILIFIVVIGANPANAQRKSKKNNEVIPEIATKTTPKLVVGIVVDQMRYDYLTRFWNHYQDDGFKRMINDGFNCKNNHYNYAPTNTGPGHASVYTGTTPATHGIISNDWYDKISGESVYCAGDDSYSSVGSTSDAGKMSPHRMLTTTITDQLRLHTQMRGKTIAIAIKDRGAVLPGGHTANGAYWFEGNTAGNWITSSYYMNELPKWVTDFNNAKSVAKYKKPWVTAKPINTYVESVMDNNAYEGLYKGETTPTFPHDFPKLWEANGGYDILKSSAYGNSLTTDFAIAAVDGENLGADDIPDFLAVSFSSTDYAGHKFGVDSKEVQDTYIRLDKDLSRFFSTLDKKIGEGEYTVFLTADHGANPVPAYLKDKKVLTSIFDSKGMKEKLNEYVKFTYGTTDLIKDISNNQIFLDHDIIKNLDIKIKDVQENLADEIRGYNAISNVYTGYQMWQNDYTRGLPHVVQNGYNEKRSGDIMYIFNTNTMTYSSTGSSHGSPHIYDTHTPLLFFGKGIKNGSTVARTEIPDIAATMAALLGVAFPSGGTGEPIIEVLD
ncbi:alkaline phosphatase PafA [Aurantibacter sp.]|uniref:alkaline phosphatase PafA n=1 Tax=Aurantibacter sp. TaxID=2807103 RepID=UPI0032652887